MNKENLTSFVLKSSEYKRKFSLIELYCALVFVLKAGLILSKNAKDKIVDRQFLKRLQLAVTEVNGCAACSYKHTQMALQQGLSNEEISSFLNGDTDYIKEDEAKAIIFAQHYADMRGKIQKDAYESIVKEYGEKKANIILSAIQVMMAGNIYGIPFSAFLSRLQKKPYKNSSLFYELTMLFFGVLMLPFALFHGFLRNVFALKNVKFTS